MKSHVIQLMEQSQAQLPDRLRRWRVTDQALQQHLEQLSRSHAFEREADQVQPGDSVVCRGESSVPRWNKPVLLFYPGKSLCESGLAEALVGCKVGESRTVAAREGSVTLTVVRIVRREPCPIDDRLVQLEQVPGVKTLDAYRRWYRQTTQEADRKRNLSYLAREVLQQTEQNSRCEIDPQEESDFVAEMADWMRQSDEAQGIDPTLPEEGTDFLTPDQVREKYQAKCRPIFRNMLVDGEIIRTLGGMDTETAYQTGLKEMAEQYYHMDVNAMLEKYPVPQSVLRVQVLFTKADQLMRQHCDRWMEE